MDRFKRFIPEFHPLISDSEPMRHEIATNPTRRDAQRRRSHMELKFVDRKLLLVYDSLERSKGYRQQIARHGAFKNLRKYTLIPRVRVGA